MSRSTLTTLHHLSAVSSHAQDTIDFYAGILGLPVLKQTVNYDDPGSYHLYFGDPALQLGTVTFFVWPGAHKGQVGIGGTSHVSFSISSDAEFERWESWLRGNGIATESESHGGGGAVLRLVDPDGLRLEFVSRDRPPETQTLAVSSAGAAPPHSAGLRLGPIEQVAVIVSDLERSKAFYVEVLGLAVESRATWEKTPLSDNHSSRFHANPASVPAVVLLQSDESTPPFRLGTGLTHHFALQVASESDLVAWRDFLNDSGTRTTDIKDRRYFRSIYFRDPDGHVVEIATKGPGFAIDEPVSELGQRLALPPWLEDRRPEITRRLPALNARPAPPTLVDRARHN